MSLHETRQDRFLPAGTRVRLDGLVNGEALASEYGVVVHCWRDEVGFYDCYVAFFGAGFPPDAPDEKPYILRYASVVLTVLES